jgi:hypothetical protein
MPVSLWFLVNFLGANQNLKRLYDVALCTIQLDEENQKKFDAQMSQFKEDKISFPTLPKIVPKWLKNAVSQIQLDRKQREPDFKGLEFILFGYDSKSNIAFSKALEGGEGGELKYQYGSRGHLEDMGMRDLTDMEPEKKVILMSHNMDSGPGMSGGPVYLWQKELLSADNTKRLFIFGVWNSGWHDDEKVFNEAIEEQRKRTENHG